MIALRFTSKQSEFGPPFIRRDHQGTVAIPSPRFELLADLKPEDPMVPSGRFVNLWNLELHMIDLTDSRRWTWINPE